MNSDVRVNATGHKGTWKSLEVIGHQEHGCVSAKQHFWRRRPRAQGESSGVSVARFVTELIEAEVATRRLKYVISGVGDPPILALEVLRARPAELPEDVGGEPATENTCTEDCTTEEAGRPSDLDRTNRFPKAAPTFGNSYGKHDVSVSN